MKSPAVREISSDIRVFIWDLSFLMPQANGLKKATFQQSGKRQQLVELAVCLMQF